MSKAGVFAASLLLALICAWLAAFLAVDAEHATKVILIFGAFGFGVAAFALLINWICDGDDDWYG